MGDEPFRLPVPRLRGPDPSLRLPSSGPLSVPDVTLPSTPLLARAQASVTLEGFALGSAELTGTHRSQLAAVTSPIQRLLSSSTGGHVQAVGHTDRVGDEANNQTLGQQRADSARDELVHNGIDTTDVRTHSLGESVPIVETTRPEPRNRRVEIYFSPGSGLNLRGIFTDHLTRPEPVSTPPIAPLPRLDRETFCRTFPDDCRPDAGRLDPSRPMPPSAPTQRRSILDVAWRPIDQSLERGLNGLGIRGEWNERLRALARAGAERGLSAGIEEVVNQVPIDEQGRRAVRTAIGAAIRMEIPF